MFTSGTNHPLSPVITEALLPQVKAVSGVADFRVLAYDPAPHKSGLYSQIEIHFSGWSPTLHPLQVRSTFTVALQHEDGSTIPEADVVAAAVSFCSPILERQLQRAQAGCLLGSSTPLLLPRMDHLQTDIAYTPIVRSLGRDPKSLMVDALRRAHCNTTYDLGKATMRSGGVDIVEYPCPDLGHIRVLLPHVKLSKASGQRVTWRGHKVLLNCGELPQTLLDGLVGQPLGAAVSIHPLLDDRIIRKVKTETTSQPVYALIIDLNTDPIMPMLADNFVRAAT